MAITRYQTEAQYEDYGADEEYLRDVISQASAPKVALFGDSISAAVGYGKDSQKDTKYGSTVADILSDYLGTSVDSQAKGGLTTKDALSGQGLPSGKTFEEYLQTNKPNVVILRYGAADAIRLNDPNQTLSNLQTMVNLAKEYGAKPILVGVSPFAAGNDIRAGNINEWSVDPYINSANTINAGIQQLAQQNSLPFVDMQKLEVPKGALLDGVHPTADFGKAMADYIGQSVKTALPEFGGSFEQYQNFTSRTTAKIAQEPNATANQLDSYVATEDELRNIVGGDSAVSSAQTASWEPLAAQILAQWEQFGISPNIKGINRANELAQILTNYGITDLSKLSLKETPYEEQVNLGYGGENAVDDWQTVTKTRGQLTYGDKTFGRLGGFGSGGEKEFAAPQEYLQAADPGRYGIGYSAAGKGWTEFEAVKDASGKTVIVPRWGSTSDLTPELVQFLAMAAAPFTGGLSASLGSALGSQVAGQIASQALISGTLGGLGAEAQGGSFGQGFGRGAITGGLTAGIGSLAAPVASSIGSEVLAAGAPQWVADAAVAATRAGAGALPQALISGDFGGVLTSALTAGASSGATSGLSNLTGLAPKDITAAVNFAQAAAAGDYTKMLSSAAAFTDSPDLALASKAASLVRAIESKNPSAIVSATKNFGSQLDQYNTYYSKTDTGDETARLQARAGTANPLADLGLTTTVGSEDLTTQDLVDIVNPPGQVATAAPAAQAPAQVTAPKTTTTTGSTTTEGSEAGFGALKIEHPNQARAAQIIKEELGDFYLNDPQWSKWFNQGGLNAAAANVFAGTEDNLREQLQGLKAGTNTSISLPSDVLRQQMAAGYNVGDYKPPEGYEIAPGGEVLSDIAYTAAGVPVNLAKKVTVTGTRAPTTLGEAASDVMNAVKGTSLEAPMAMAIGAGGELGQAGAGFLTWFANLPKDHSINRTFNEITKAAEQGVPQEVKDSWKNWRDRVGKADGFVGTLKEGVLAAPENWKGLLWETGKEILQEIPTLGMGLAVRGTAMGLALAQKVATRLGIGVATAMEMVENGGAAYNEAVGLSLQKLDPLVKSGKITAEQAAYLSHGAGAEALLTGSAITGALSLIPGGNALIQQIVGRELQSGATNFAQTIVNTAITGAKAAGKEFITEGVEEGGTRAGVEYAATGQINPQTVAYNAITGAFVGGLTSGSVASVDALQQNLRDAYAGQSDDTVIGKNPQTGQDVTLKQTIDALEARKQEPTFDSSTVVATDPDTGDDITLGDLTGATIRDAEVSTRVEPTLEALEDTELDSRQIISDYVSEVLGGGADTDAAVDPLTGDTASQTNTGTVVSVDPANNTALVIDTNGNTNVVQTTGDVTVGQDINLGGTADNLGDATGAPTVNTGTVISVNPEDNTALVADPNGNTNIVSVATGTNPGDSVNLGTDAVFPGTATDTASGVTPRDTVISAPAPDDVTTAPNTGTVLAVDPESGEALVIDSSGNTNVVTVGPDVREGQVIDLGVAEQPAAQPVADVAATPRVDAATGATSQTSTDPATNTTTVNVVDPSSNTTTTTVTNNNTGVESSTRVEANNNTTTEVVVDPTAGTQTETTTDNNTGTTTQTTTDTTTGVTTDTTTNVAPDTTTGVTSDTATDVQPEVVTDVTTTPDTATEVVTQPETQVTPETTTQPEVVAEPETTVEPDTTVQPEIDTTPELRQGSITDPDTGDVFMVTIDRQGNIIEVLDYIPFTGDVGTEPIFDENFPVDFAPEPDVTTEPGITPEPDVTPEPDITTQPVTDTSPEPPELPIDTDLPPMTEEDLLDIVQPPVVPPDQTTVPPAQPPVAQPPVAQPPVGAPPAGPPPAAPGTPAQTQQQKLQALLQSIQGQPQQWQVTPPILAGEFTPQYNPYLLGPQQQNPQMQNMNDLLRMLGYNQ